MAIQLLTLNVEGDRHLERVHAALGKHLPDVACLQEVLESDCAYLASSGRYDVNFSLCGHLPGEPSLKRNWGVAVLSRVPVHRHSTRCYSEDAHIRTIHVPNDPRRMLVVTELEHQGQPYRIATTHFTWTPDGHISQLQQADFARLSGLLSHCPDYVLCGDFNAPRGREMFSRFVEVLGLTDHLPARVTSTIDGQFHKAGALELVVDTIFSTREYCVTDLRVLAGISDHKGILARIERPPGD